MISLRSATYTMKAVLRHFKDGEIRVADVPPPNCEPGMVLVHNVASLVSAGTEKATIELAAKNPLEKARARPDLVKKILNKAQQEGVVGTARSVMNLMSSPMPLGYSCAGIVKAVGEGVTEFRPGDHVACAGANYANHAEVVCVPRNLTVAVPDGVDLEDAAYVTMGAIAMQGVRQADLTLGDSVVVVGLGLLGLLTVQLCAAAGCRVFGLDIAPGKLDLARQLGATDTALPSDSDLVDRVRRFSGGHGADTILITAATESSGPIKQAAALARDRARVVAVGDVGLDVPRREYYEKELDLRLSRSYGPGRYDVSYEEQGTDYPIGYVRWTENRNMSSFLELVATKRIDLSPITTHRFPIAEAEDAYALLSPKNTDPYLGIILQYNAEKEQTSTVTMPAGTAKHDAELSFGIIGAGQFAQGILLPRLVKLPGVALRSIATGSGLTAEAVAGKYGCVSCTSDYTEILADEAVNAVLIATRHHLHAQIASDALKAGKHVFVEKPLAIDTDGAALVAKALASLGDTAPAYLVGFNRRFSPLAVWLKSRLPEGQYIVHYRVNAGAIPEDSWVHDPASGGGRIIGEGCHFIDLMAFMTGATPVSVTANAVPGAQRALRDPDNLTVEITFSDGSIGSLIYAADGDSGFPKERMEIFGQGAVGTIENWRRADLHLRGKHHSRVARLSAQKGHAEELAAFVDATRSGLRPISLESMFATTYASFAIREALSTGERVNVAAPNLRAGS